MGDTWMTLSDICSPQVVKAFVVLRGDYESVNKDVLTAELQQMVKDVTAPYKYPRKVCQRFVRFTQLAGFF